MRHTVAPVLNQIRLKQFVLLCKDAVAQLTRIAHGDFLIPALLADHLLPLERVKARQRDIQTRQGYVHRRVLHILRKVEVSGKRQTDA